MINNNDFWTKLTDRKCLQSEIDTDAIGRVLCKKAEDLKCCAVIMAKRKQPPMKEFFMGSVSKYCVAHCEYPVIITRWVSLSYLAVILWDRKTWTVLSSSSTLVLDSHNGRVPHCNCIGYTSNAVQQWHMPFRLFIIRSFLVKCIHVSICSCIWGNQICSESLASRVPCLCKSSNIICVHRASQNGAHETRTHVARAVHLKSLKPGAMMYGVSTHASKNWWLFPSVTAYSLCAVSSSTFDAGGTKACTFDLDKLNVGKTGG